MGIPRELEDAAKLDGAGHARILWDIIIPATRGADGAGDIHLHLLLERLHLALHHHQQSRRDDDDQR